MSDRGREYLYYIIKLFLILYSNIKNKGSIRILKLTIFL